jgi:hypothetical protein
MKRTILTLIAIALLSASISAQSTEERLPTRACQEFCVWGVT